MYSSLFYCRCGRCFCITQILAPSAKKCEVMPPPLRDEQKNSPGLLVKGAKKKEKKKYQKRKKKDLFWVDLSRAWQVYFSCFGEHVFFSPFFLSWIGMMASFSRSIRYAVVCPMKRSPTRAAISIYIGTYSTTSTVKLFLFFLLLWTSSAVSNQNTSGWKAPAWPQLLHLLEISKFPTCTRLLKHLWFPPPPPPTPHLTSSPHQFFFFLATERKRKQF